MVRGVSGRRAASLGRWLRARRAPRDGGDRPRAVDPRPPGRRAAFARLRLPLLRGSRPGRRESVDTGAQVGVRAGGDGGARVRDPRGRLLAQRLLLRRSSRTTRPPTTPAFYSSPPRGPRRRDALLLVGVAAVAVVEPDPVPRPPAGARDHSIRRGRPARVRPRSLTLAAVFWADPFSDQRRTRRPEGQPGSIRCCCTRRLMG